MSNASARFIVGIDLGTTNSAVAYVDTTASPWRVELFEVPQLVAPGQVEPRAILPSFHYQPVQNEFPPGSLRLPWQSTDPDYVVGLFAREQGALQPGRLISSAKSWLCHGGVDRQAALLPWYAAPDVTRISPVEASARYLRHIREAWDWRFPEAPLAAQQVVLTLPASFDEIARELTLRAAFQAGLGDVTLIEEPQAAFYAWMYLQGERWREAVSPNQTILVCDIGGGTTDFTLIRALPAKEGAIRLDRIAVGDHLILGGDNLDLALAYFVEKQLVGDGRLEPRVWGQLVNLARRWKELLLGDDAPEELRVHLPGVGGRVIGGGWQILLKRREVDALLVDGFFPMVSLEAEPTRVASGFREFGLPYAPDPGVTRYLAAFLRAHRHAVENNPHPEAVRPDLVLFNGGVFESSRLRRRIIHVLESWFNTPSDSEWSIKVLKGDRLDLAVARGAAYYGMVRRGYGVRIGSGLPRSYYLGVGIAPPTPEAPTAEAPDASMGHSAESAGTQAASQSAENIALCVIPAGIEPGDQVVVDNLRMELILSQPVEFPLYVSTTRSGDKPGQMLPVLPEQLTALAPLRTVLRRRKRGEAEAVNVRLHARLTEIGTLDLWLEEFGGKNKWKLQFDVRKSFPAEVNTPPPGTQLAVLEESAWENCEKVIEETFGDLATVAPEGVLKRLVAAIGLERHEWPATLLRRLWEALIDREAARHKSPQHEARWLNLVGFALRPGFGVPLDDWRVEETWRQLQGKLVHPTPTCRTEWYVMWRRIAGGLSAGCQQALADPLLAAVRNLARQLRAVGHGTLPFTGHEAAEVWRLLGALELLPVSVKAEVAQLIVDLLVRDKFKAQQSAFIWALGRIGARQLSYGPLNAVISPDVVSEWLERLLKIELNDPHFHLALMQLARKTDDRFRDVPERLRRRVADWLRKHSAKEHLIQLVVQGGQLEKEETEAIFGEKLPLGLRVS
ncbi:MAG: hsp70 family protein [Thermoguttaceae bacterium]|nr:hsp70 family protein [Thermoguttaceae bacterium]MDW8078699.1 Hsp70 family protein [Thermoguttaceae bacterium]